MCLSVGFRFPVARCLVKIHKPVVKGRLLVASTCYLSCPAAVFLARELQTLLARVGSVASSTDDVINSFNGVDFNDVIEFTLDHVLAVHPVHREALVLSMSSEDVKEFAVWLGSIRDE